jgi:chromosomal replication initiator protein
MPKERQIVHPYIFVGVHYQEIMETYAKEVTPKKATKPLKITQNEILQIVANECDVTVEDILSKSRKQNIVDARYICFAAFKLRCGLSLQDIGKIVANRDHTTVIHGLRSFHDRYTVEQHYKNTVDRVFEQIQIDYDGKKLTCANMW